MYERNLVVYVKDMIENMEKSEIFVKDLNYEDFVSDEKTHYAV